MTTPCKQLDLPSAARAPGQLVSRAVHNPPPPERWDRIVYVPVIFVQSVLRTVQADHPDALPDQPAPRRSRLKTALNIAGSVLVLYLTLRFPAEMIVVMASPWLYIGCGWWLKRRQNRNSHAIQNIQKGGALVNPIDF